MILVIVWLCFAWRVRGTQRPFVADIFVDGFVCHFIYFDVISSILIITHALCFQWP